jgi:hypothetical protein
MATTNSLKFYRKSTAPSSPVAGAIWFNTTDKTIQIYTGTEWEKYAGNLKDATWSSDKKTLTITKYDGSSLALDFSDMASATVMGKMITAVGLNTDGTFKKNAANYGGSATSIGGEISAIDAKLKSVSDLVGATSVATQINSVNVGLIGLSGDGTEVNTIYGAKAHATAKADAAESKAKKYTDDALEALAGTVSSTAGEKVVVSVNQTNGKVDAVTVTLDDIASANELADVKATAEAAQTADEVSTAITNAINALDATVSDEHDPNVKVSVTETDGKLTGVTVTTADIASAATLADVKGKVDAFFAGASIDDTVNQYKDTLKELQTYMTEDAAAAVSMTESIAANKSDIVKLAGAKVNNKSISTTQIGTDGATTLLVSGVILDGKDIKLTGYSKGTAADLAATDTINQALGKLEARVDAAAAGGVQSVNGITGSVVIDTGSTNGSIKVGSGDVAVKGLKSAAYTESSAYATAAQGDKADTAVQNVTVTAAHGYDTNKEIVTVTKGNDNAINLAFNFANITEIKGGSYLSEISSSGGPLVRAAVVSEIFRSLDENKANKATTLSGYGITDAYTKTEVDALLCWDEF